MALEETDPFEKLWSKAIQAYTGNNTIYYHNCCDTWSNRHRKNINYRHCNVTSWSKLISGLGSSMDEKKAALKVKMIKEHWQLPAIFNQN